MEFDEVEAGRQRRDHVLLLTACIDPGKSGAVQVHRSDPSIRTEDYKQALASYLAMPCPHIKGIVLAENSGSDLGPLIQFAEGNNTFSRKLEFLSFDGNVIPEGVHYGYAEMGIIDRALDSCEVLRASPHFVKATGRLFFPKLPKLLEW